MRNAKLSLHGITKIEIAEPESSDGTVWRYVTFIDEDGNKFTVTSFPSEQDVEAVPVSFVRDLDEDPS